MFKVHLLYLKSVFIIRQSVFHLVLEVFILGDKKYKDNYPMFKGIRKFKIILPFISEITSQT